ncbi:response regulator transcription factor [Xanthobacter sp. AM11]|uniref:response regulator transcription factor n=1 Tax=Xanthobacter sp. AM11 TaxID=3380643 RepID=UPI0039BFB73C
MRLLLVEDTVDVAEAIAASFARRGDAMDTAHSFAEARDLLEVQDYDVAIFDIELGDGKGTDILKLLRAAGKATPVLMLTAQGAIDHRVAALDAGADDYMVKPFDLRELQARVRALARRAGDDRMGLVIYGELIFDPAGRTARVRDTVLTLTRREFSLLETLIACRGRVAAKEHIFERMFGFGDEEVGLSSVETYVARLRRKLEGSTVKILTLRGLGYQLVVRG